MGRAAVELDDEALGSPEAVDLVPLGAGFEPDVRLRARQVVLVDEGDEGVLEHVLGYSQVAFRERGSDGARARSPWIAGEEVAEGEGVPEAVDLGLVDEAGDLALRSFGRQVEDGP